MDMFLLEEGVENFVEAEANSVIKLASQPIFKAVNHLDGVSTSKDLFIFLGYICL